MKLWVRLTLIALTVGGGYTGAAATLQNLLRPQEQRAVYFVMTAVFLVLYALVTACGLLFVHDQGRTFPLIVAFAIQIPWFSSPLLAYRFTAGFHASVGFLGGNFTGGFSFGSGWQCDVFQNLPCGIGVNIFALVIVIFLARSSERRKGSKKGVILKGVGPKH